MEKQNCQKCWAQRSGNTNKKKVEILNLQESSHRPPPPAEVQRWSSQRQRETWRRHWSQPQDRLSSWVCPWRQQRWKWKKNKKFNTKIFSGENWLKSMTWLEGISSPLNQIFKQFYKSFLFLYFIMYNFHMLSAWLPCMFMQQQINEWMEMAHVIIPIDITPHINCKVFLRLCK